MTVFSLMHLGDRVHWENNRTTEQDEMTKQEKIQYVSKLTMTTEEVAKAYLEAEEWLVDEAVYTIEAERKAGIFKE